MERLLSGALRSCLPWAAGALLALGGVAGTSAPAASQTSGSGSATRVAAAAADALVERGRQLFMTETFGGNGRTCATCHRPDNNYTIDPAYIAKLSPSDPLFVAETNPALRDLERPLLLRRLGLVTVNIDGLDKPAVPRAVPHLLGLRLTTKVEPGGLTPPGGKRDLRAATGWSGDGAGGDGSLRVFPVAAVVQHFPKTLARRSGVDYRLPSGAELDALEAFLLSLGRREEVDVADGSSRRLRFTSAAVETGRALFNADRSGPCSSCHVNAGALDEDGFNVSFDIGVAQRPNSPMRMIDPSAPGDGGFGASPAIQLAGRSGFGDGRFSTPSVIEAADTEPLFHDHSAPSIEAAVFFYTSPTFKASPEGKARPGIDLKRPDVAAIAAFLRTLNALDNIRSSNAKLAEAGKQAAAAAAGVAIDLAIADTEDAIRVLVGASGLYGDAVKVLQQALALERRARGTSAAPARNDLLRQAVDLKTRARNLMVS